jgi:hypothetical protein
VTALFIVMVGVVSAYNLLNQTIAASSSISMRLTAAYLGKEGIEIVKNIRDSNYLKIHYEPDGTYNWVNGLTSDSVPGVNAVDCSGLAGNPGCRAQYDSNILSNVNVDQPLTYSAATGFFSYDPAGTPTVYRRIITVEPNGDILNVSVGVNWTERGKPFSLTVRENIYNWWR